LPDGWLRYVEPSEDRNRARWPVHPDWEVIQRAFEPEPDEETPCEREERKRQEEEEELLQEVDAELAAHPFQETETPVRRCRGQKQVAPAASRASRVAEAAAELDLRPVVRKRKRQVNTRRMIEQLTGCFVTLEAWRGTPEQDASSGVEADLSDTVHYGYTLMQGYLEEKDRDFSEQVERKRVLYSVEVETAA
jgi:hypothetical protein